MRPIPSFHNLFALALGCAWVLALSPACCGQNNLFLRVSGVAGESTASGHVGDIDATGFSLGVINSDATRPAFSDLSVTKYVDKASPLLMLRCAQGTAIASVVLFVQSTSPSALDFYKVTLTNARVTRLDTAGSVADKPVETVSFTYDSIEIIYTPRNADGTPGTPVRACWDQVLNKAC